ncbi:MAG: NAD-dependent deacylase [Anaerolineae bacterium]
MLMADISNETIDHAVQLLRQAKHVVAFTGAGISTPSGIPDFRSTESGLWNQVDPMEVASLYGFRQNPQAFYDWIRPLARLTWEAQPNAAHYALARLEAGGYLKAIITQNIDMLHTRAGNKQIFELHGHMREMTCTHCFGLYLSDPIMTKFVEDGIVPRCPKCNGVLKPNVILFGEQLPMREFQGAQRAARNCDLMIIVGSSLEVAPASDLPLMALRSGAKLIIVNLQTTPLDHDAMVIIQANCAEILPAIVERLESVS